jgi:integrase
VTSRPKCACLNPNAPRRMFGALRVLPSGRHQARYVGPDGRTYKATGTFDTHGDADAFLARVRSEISREVWQPPASKRSVPDTFGQYAEDWLLVRELQPRTRAHYRSLLDQWIIPGLGDLPIKSISPSLVRSWYAACAEGRPTTRAHAYGLLRGILATAVTDEIIPANPCHIRGAGAAKRQITIKPATLPELGRLVAAMPEKYRVMTLLAAWCGLRFGELTELRRKDIDLKNGVIHVRRGVVWVESKPVVGKPKSDAGVRDVAIPPHLLPAIKDHLRDHAGIELLFPSPQGVQLTTSTLYASFWPARKAAGRPDLRWHDLRHTGAVLAASTGATLADLMARLGHSTPAAALRYQHAAEGKDALIAKALSALAAENAQ